MPPAPSRPRLGIIGGSGLYQLDGLTDISWQAVSSPWGAPSDELLFGRLGQTDLVFLPRHGRGHRLLPSEINYRANIDALKRAGVTDIVSLSACGSFRRDMPPGTFVLVDQFIDRTTGRAKSFFGNGVITHMSAADPVCACLGRTVAAAAQAQGLPLHQGGAYLCIDGPQFSTRAESKLYRSWGADVIGMTNMPEALLAREAEIRYQSVAMVTDFDAWADEDAAVETSNVLAVMHANAAAARGLVAAIARQFPPTVAGCARSCMSALDNAVLTPPADWPKDAWDRLDSIAGRLRP